MLFSAEGVRYHREYVLHSAPAGPLAASGSTDGNLDAARYFRLQLLRPPCCIEGRLHLLCLLLRADDFICDRVMVPHRHPNYLCYPSCSADGWAEDAVGGRFHSRYNVATRAVSSIFFFLWVSIPACFPLFFGDGLPLHFLFIFSFQGDL